MRSSIIISGLALAAQNILLVAAGDCSSVCPALIGTACQHNDEYAAQNAYIYLNDHCHTNKQNACHDPWAACADLCDPNQNSKANINCLSKFPVGNF